MFSRLPLWVRWIVAALLFGAAGAGFLSLVRDSRYSYSSDPASEAEANRLARVVAAEKQRPRTTTLRAGTPPRKQLERAIASDARRRIGRGELNGRLGRATCRDRRTGSGGRVAFSCHAAVGRVKERFVGVTDARARRVTWCRHHTASGSGLTIPLSPRCTGR